MKETTKNSKTEIWIVIVVLAVILVPILLCGSYFLLDKVFTHKYETSDISEYGKWTGHMEYEMDAANEKLYIFPEPIAPYEDAEYYYSSKVDSSSYDSGVILVKVKYSEEEFEKEINRLSKITCTINVDGVPVTNRIEYREDLFKYPSYVSVYNSNQTYEYALVDEPNRTIIYTYLHLMIPKEKQVPDEYMPQEYDRDELYDESSWNNTNIYFAENKDGDYVSCESNGHVVITIK